MVVIDLHTPSTLYAAGALGVAKSTDRGTTWNPLPGAAASLYVFDLAISPSSPATLYATGTSAQQRMLRTTDGGATWSPVQQRFPTIPLSLAIDPLMPATVFTASGGDIYETSNGGDTWSLVNKAFHDQTIQPLAMSPAGLLYGAVWFDNVYESADDGATWSPLGESPTRSSYTVLAVDPLNPCRLYAGTLNRGLLAFTKTGTAECN
jgi:photosystem II stability/assembly factor-like uncharacterized protein